MFIPLKMVSIGIDPYPAEDEPLLSVPKHLIFLHFADPLPKYCCFKSPWLFLKH